ncbi:hypothetical protein [Modicisalibacter ilicicola]|nr:hypothetical protein [Halomonas ilicicola]
MYNALQERLSSKASEPYESRRGVSFRVTRHYPGVVEGWCQTMDGSSWNTCFARSQEAVMDNPVKDKNYDMISSLYHLAQGSEMSKQYARDAEKEGDNDAVQLFNELQRNYSEFGDKIARLLKERL